MSSSQHVYKIRPRKDRCGVDLIFRCAAIRSPVAWFRFHRAIARDANENSFRLAFYVSNWQAETMGQSRRQFLKAGAAATAGLVTAPLAAGTPNILEQEAVARAIVSLFNTLPGDKALKIFARSARRKPRLVVQ